MHGLGRKHPLEPGAERLIWPDGRRTAATGDQDSPALLYDRFTIFWHIARMPEPYDLTLLDPDCKLGRDIAIMRTEIEELHAKLARMPAVIARAALGIIFSTAIITTLLGWWFLAR